MSLTSILLTVIILGNFLFSLFLAFIYSKNYRFASFLFDMLPLYPFLIIVNSITPVLLSLFLSNWEVIRIVVILYFVIVGGVEFTIFYSWQQNYRLNFYRKLLQELKNDKRIEILDIRKWLENPERKDTKTLVLIRHDVDISLNRTRKMIEIETELQVPTCYYFRENATTYTYQEAVSLIREIKHHPSIEIGYHYATLTSTKGDLDAAIVAFTKEVDKFRKVVPEMMMVSAHGDKYNNRQLVRDKFLNLEEYGLVSAYDLGHDLYISEAGGGHHFRLKEEKVTFKQKLKILEHPQSNTLVQILIHPDWWF